MSTDPSATNGQDPNAEPEADLTGTNYETIRRRLENQTSDLRARAKALNESRVELFGSTRMERLGSKQIVTNNACIPRDIITVKDQILFGYNVYKGLQATQVDELLSLHTLTQSGDTLRFEQVAYAPEGNFLAAPDFVHSFRELLSFYKDTELVQLRWIERARRLLAIFKIGSSLSDTRVFRWDVPANGPVTFKDNRGSEDNVYEDSHGFKWTSTNRNDHVTEGPHPHISIAGGKVFVETIGGDLTIKVEDNTEDGLGIYREDVEDKHQSLNDAQVAYVDLGSLVLMRILPRRESTTRYFIFNTLNNDVQRLDAIGHACQVLPADHGIIFPGGYYLRDGGLKMLNEDIADVRFETRIDSPNGEDVMYVFYDPIHGEYVLFSYNVIRKEVQTPVIHCHGYCVLHDGKMIFFKSKDQAVQNHDLNIWQTPYMNADYAAKLPRPGGDSPLGAIGNSTLVAGISECYSICRAVGNQKPTVPIYRDLIRQIARAMRNYDWFDQPAAGNIREVLEQIQDTAGQVLGEFEKVTALREQAQQALEAAEAEQQTILNSVRGDWEDIDRFVKGLASLDRQRGRLVGLAEVRYMDLERLKAMSEEADEAIERLSQRTVAYMLKDEALDPYRQAVAEGVEGLEELTKASEVEALRARMDEIAEGLNLLTEIVSELEVDDSTARTQILESIIEVLSTVNRSRAQVEAQRKKLQEGEGRAEFSAQFSLFSQSVTSALSMADTPEACDAQLTRLMLQLEALESRFSTFDMFLEDIATKRDEVFEIFEQKKQTLLEERQRRAQNTFRAAERSLKGVKRRANAMKTIDELNAYFVGDAMIRRIRELVTRLRDLGDDVKADDVESQLASSRDEAVRTIRDKQELYEDGAAIVKLGRHRFSVNTQAIELTILPHDDTMALHLSGTDFYEPIEDASFIETQTYWDQKLPSETADVYRGEYLAACIYFDAIDGANGMSVERLHEEFAREEGLIPLVRSYFIGRNDEDYKRGVHDADTAIILEKLLALHSTTGLLRFSAEARASACLFWASGIDRAQAERWQRRARSLGRLRETFQTGEPLEDFGEELAEHIQRFFHTHRLRLDPHGDHDALPDPDAPPSETMLTAGRYLAEELIAQRPRFVTASDADRLREAFVRSLDERRARRDFEDDLRAFEDDIASRYQLALGWIKGFIAQQEDDLPAELRRAYIEAAVVMMTDGKLDRTTSAALTSVEATGLLGEHPRIQDQKLTIQLDRFIARMRHFAEHRVPGYRRYRNLRQDLLAKARTRLRLEALKPNILSSFVRNKLINDVYLPLIGDNLAKQMGTVGENKRTDRMGLLLLVSPPGYGKTTLMEYIANRLGLIFMKINGPALGHDVVSLDPDEAPNATARQEVERLNMALEMANNVMLYLDDIQHTNPELLQKFISLCDGQRKIEGVWRGRTRTYDLGGKRFCVCMAGNPYTESGDVFQIPDMLANRADTYNLGDLLGSNVGNRKAFEMSYVENALTSNPTLAPLATRDQKDVYAFMRMAEGEEVAPTDLSHAYPSSEVSDIVAVLQKLSIVRDVLLKVNAQYVASAAIDDAYRTEPPFKLQGSYRNMAKVAEKVASVMTDQEVEDLISEHYQGESQTLTTDARQNILKLGELRDNLTPKEQEEWDRIKSEFSRRLLMGGSDDDPIARVAGPLSSLVQQLQNVHASLTANPVAERLDALNTNFDRLQLALTGDPIGPRLDTLSGHLTDIHASLTGDPLAEPLTALSEHLASIDEALRTNSTVAEHLGSLRNAMGAIAQSVRSQVALSSERPAFDAEQFTPLLERLEQALIASVREQPEIRVVNEAPDNVRDVLTHQIEVLEWTLIPLVRTMAQDAQFNAESSVRLGEILDRLKLLQRQVVSVPSGASVGRARSAQSAHRVPPQFAPQRPAQPTSHPAPPHPSHRSPAGHYPSGYGHPSQPKPQAPRPQAPHQQRPKPPGSGVTQELPTVDPNNPYKNRR